MSHTPRKIMIVDDQELIRTGFALILQSAGEFVIVGDASDGADALQVLEKLHAAQQLPDVVLMDVRMPGMDGIAATQAIIESYPAIRVLVLTTFDIDEYALDAIAAGASGFLLKDARAGELIEAVRAVAEGDSVIDPQVTRRLLLRLHETQAEEAKGEARNTLSLNGEREGTREAAPASAVQPQLLSNAKHERLEVLTDREYEVFTLISEGLSNAEIGERLFLSESTVKTHVGRVLSKLELRDRVHAVILAFELGIESK